MRSANTLTPFDFPTISASVISTVAARPAGNGTSFPQSSQVSMQPIPAMQLAQFSDVEMVVSRGALGGWVEQASPACGAASVAGAWNAVKPAGKLQITSAQDLGAGTALFSVYYGCLISVVLPLLCTRVSFHPAKPKLTPACKYDCIRVCIRSCSTSCLASMSMSVSASMSMHTPSCCILSAWHSNTLH